MTTPRKGHFIVMLSPSYNSLLLLWGIIRESKTAILVITIRKTFLKCKYLVCLQDCVKQKCYCLVTY